MSEYLFELIDASPDWLNHELWAIVTLQTESVLLGIFLWQHKCLFHFPIVEIGEVDTAEVAIASATGTHDPMSVARPGWIAVSKALTVELGEIHE